MPANGKRIRGIRWCPLHQDQKSPSEFFSISCEAARSCERRSPPICSLFTRTAFTHFIANGEKPLTTFLRRRRPEDAERPSRGQRSADFSPLQCPAGQGV